MSLGQPEPFPNRRNGEAGAALQQRYSAVCAEQHRAAVRNAGLVQGVRRLQHQLALSGSQPRAQLATLKQQYEQHVAAEYPGWLAEVDRCSGRLLSSSPAAALAPASSSSRLSAAPARVVTSPPVSPRQPDPLTTRPSKIPVLLTRVKPHQERPPSSERIPPSSSIKTRSPALPELSSSHPSTPQQCPPLPKPAAISGDNADSLDTSLTSTTTSTADTSPNINSAAPPSASFSTPPPPTTTKHLAETDTPPGEAPQAAASASSQPDGGQTPPAKSLTGSPQSPPARPSSPLPWRPDSTDPIHLLDDLSMHSSSISMETPSLVGATATTMGELTASRDAETDAGKLETPVLDETFEQLAEPVMSLEGGAKETHSTTMAGDESELSEPSAAAVPLHESTAYRSLTQPSRDGHELGEDDEASSLLLSEESAIAALEREIQSSAIADHEGESLASSEGGLEEQNPSLASTGAAGTAVASTSALQRRLGFLGDSDSECDLPPSPVAADGQDELDDFDFYN